MGPSQAGRSTDSVKMIARQIVTAWAKTNQSLSSMERRRGGEHFKKQG